MEVIAGKIDPVTAIKVSSILSNKTVFDRYEKNCGKASVFEITRLLNRFAESKPLNRGDAVKQWQFDCRLTVYDSLPS